MAGSVYAQFVINYDFIFLSETHKEKQCSQQMKTLQLFVL